MLAIWPTQKTGAETPTRATTISSGSKIVPRSKAAAIPTPIASTTQSTAAPKTSDNVAGAAAAISGATLTPWVEDHSRSPVMKIFFLIMPDSIRDRPVEPELRADARQGLRVRAAAGERTGRVDARRLEEDDEHDDRDHEHDQHGPQQAPDDKGQHERGPLPRPAFTSPPPAAWPAGPGRP